MEGFFFTLVSFTLPLCLQPSKKSVEEIFYPFSFRFLGNYHQKSEILVSMIGFEKLPRIIRQAQIVLLARPLPLQKK